MHKLIVLSIVCSDASVVMLSTCPAFNYIACLRAMQRAARMLAEQSPLLLADAVVLINLAKPEPRQHKISHQPD